MEDFCRPYIYGKSCWSLFEGLLYIYKTFMPLHKTFGSYSLLKGPLESSLSLNYVCKFFFLQNIFRKSFSIKDDFWSIFLYIEKHWKGFDYLSKKNLFYEKDCFKLYCLENKLWRFSLWWRNIEGFICIDGRLDDSHSDRHFWRTIEIFIENYWKVFSLY